MNAYQKQMALQRLAPTAERAERIAKIQANQAQNFAYIQRTNPALAKQIIERKSRLSEKRAARADAWAANRLNPE